MSVKLLLMALCISISGCANLYYPRLPGPAEEVECQITRSGGLIGEYHCIIDGRYELRDAF